MKENVNLILIRMFLKNTVFKYDDKHTRTKYKPYRDWTAEEWGVFVSDRTDLFLTHVLPTLKAQTCQDFDCLLIIDKTFPGYSLVQEKLEANPHFKILYTDCPWGDGPPAMGWEVFLPPFQALIQTYVEENYPDCEWLTTKRLDSDDLLCNDFVERMLEEFEKDKKEKWIIFQNGYNYEPNSEYGIYRHTDWRCEHHTYCEPFTDSLKTVHHRMHNKLGLVPGCDTLHIIGEGRDEPWAKGYWLDFCGLLNAAKNSQVSGRWTRSKWRAQAQNIADLKANFTLSIDI